MIPYLGDSLPQTTKAAKDLKGFAALAKRPHNLEFLKNLAHQMLYVGTARANRAVGVIDTPQKEWDVQPRNGKDGLDLCRKYVGHARHLADRPSDPLTVLG